MGYTHYWRKVNDITEEHVDAINSIINRYEKETGKKIVNDLGEAGTQPLITTDLVALNGEEDESCEALYLKPHQKGFQFCKTNRRSYNEVVCAVLAYLDDQGVIKGLDSDDDIERGEEWITAKNLLHRALA